MVATARPTAPRTAAVGIVLSFALAVGVGVLRTLNAEPVERSAEVVGTAAFAIAFAGPALLALIGTRRRPSLLAAAGALDLALAFLSLISLVGVVFLPPAVLFFVAASRMRGAGAGTSRSIAAVLVATTLGTLAFFALFAREDPVCWARNATTGESVRLDADRFVHGSGFRIDGRDLPPGTTESGCSSDTISTGEGLTSIAVVAVMLASAWFLAAPQEPLVARLRTTG